MNVLDLNQGTLIDWFEGIRPSVSPTGRFIVYVKVFPLHGFPGVSYEYLAYDLLLEPLTNRTEPNRQNKMWKPEMDPFGQLYDPYNVGWPLYPPGVFNTGTDNLFDEDHLSSIHFMASDKFYWLDDFKVAFIDKCQENTMLVVADLKDDVTRPVIITRALDALATVDAKACKQEEGLNKSRNDFLVTKIDLLKKESDGFAIRLKLRGSSCTHDTLDLFIPSQ